MAEGLLDTVLCAAHDENANGGLVWHAMSAVPHMLDLLLLAAAGVAAAAAGATAAEAGLAAAIAEAAADMRRALGGSTAAEVGPLLILTGSDDWWLPARRLASALLAWWKRREAKPAAMLELAQAAAARSCAYLRCANLGGEGGPGAGQGVGSMRCRWVGGWWGVEALV